MDPLEKAIADVEKRLGATSADSSVVPNPAVGGTVSAPTPTTAGTHPLSLLGGDMTQPAATPAQPQSPLQAAIADVENRQAVQPKLPAFFNAVSNANATLAAGIGYPADVIANIMQKIGLNVVKDFESGRPYEWGDAQRAVQAAFQQAGFIPYNTDYESTSGKIGQEAAKGIAVTAALMYGGTAAATEIGVKGLTNVSAALQNIVNAMRAHPVQTVLADIGAATAGVIGEEKGGPLGAFGGALTGGALTTLATAVTTKLASTVAKPVKGAYNAIAGMFEGRPKVVPDAVADRIRTVSSNLDQVNDDITTAAEQLRTLKAQGAGPDQTADLERWLFSLRGDERPGRQGQFSVPAGKGGVRGQLEAELRQLEDSLPKGAKIDDYRGAVRDEIVDPARSQVFAEDQVADQYKRIENQVLKVVDEVRPRTNETAENFAIRVNERIDQAEDAARKLESVMWNRTPLREKMPMQGVRDNLEGLTRELEADYNEAFIPRKLITEASELGKPMVRDPETGKVISQGEPPTLAQVHSFVSKVNTEARKEAAERAPNRQLIANMYKVVAAVNKGISDAFPDDVSIAQARAVSTKVNDIFTRSNLRDILAAGPEGAAKVHPGQTVDYLMSRYQGLQDILTMHKDMSAFKRVQGQGNAYPTALDPADLASAKEAVALTEDAIRARFREMTAELTDDPRQIERVAKELSGKVKPMAEVSRQLESVGAQMAALREERKLIEGSALARYVKGDAKDAIQRVWRGGADEARELIRTFRGDPDAIEGLRAGIIDELTTRTKFDPTRMQSMMADPKVDRLLRTVLPESQYNRLEKIVDTAYRLERGDFQSFSQQHASTYSTLASVFGAGIGRHIPRLFGMGGTVQTPGIFARLMREKTMSFLFQDDAKVLLREAIRDEGYEKLLLKKDPTSLSEWAQSVTFARRTIAAMEGLRQAGESYWDEQSQRRQAQDEGQFASTLLHPAHGETFYDRGIDLGDQVPNSKEWAERTSVGGVFGNLVKAQANPTGKRTPFEEVLSRYPDKNPSVEDRRTSDKTITGYRKLVEGADSVGLGQVPALHSFAARERKGEVPFPPRRP